MKKHKKEITPITYATTLENARKWLNIVRYGESGTVIQLQDDCEFRILEIIQNSKLLRSVLGPYYRKYLLTFISLDGRDFHNSVKETLVNLCLMKKIGTKGTLKKLSNSELLTEIAERGYDVGLFIIHIATLLSKKHFQQLYDMELLISTNKNLSVIVFSELDITHARFTLLADKASFLFDHVIKYPLYSYKDARQFASYYLYQWDFTLPEKVITDIIESCGGYLWIIHQVLRGLRDNPTMTVSEALSQNLVIKKLEVIWAKLTDAEREILRKIQFNTLNKLDTLSHEYEYLGVIKMIQEVQGRSKLMLPLLSKVIERENRLSALKVASDRILLGEKDITSSLTRQEKVFIALLLCSKRKIVSREKISQIVWGNNWEEKYSDWAIDRLAYRIRKKLKSLGLEEKMLITVKKKGFVFG